MSAVDSGLNWIENAIADGCPDYVLQSQTRDVLLTVLQATRDEGGPDAAGAVAQRLVERAEHGRPPSATQARKIAREELRDRGHDISMTSPLARSSHG